MSLRKYFKRLGRKTAATSVKVNRIVVPVVSAVGSYFGGPIVGAAVTAIGSQPSYYWRATQARNEGLKGRAARKLGRNERKRVAIYGSAASGVGSIASGITTAAMGGTFSQSVGAAGAGQYGSSVLGNSSTVFSVAERTARDFGSSSVVTAGNFANQVGRDVPGIVTEASLVGEKASTVPGIVTTLGTSAPGAAGGTSALTTAATSVATSLLGKVLNPPMKPGGGIWDPTGGATGGGSGGGGGGDSSGMPSFGNSPLPGGSAGGSSWLLPALLIGGVILLSA